MKESNLDITLIEQISEELAIDPSFIEKDWYATQALRVIHAADSKECRFIFAGGTCLSKAYGLIERFSEDIDFKIAGELLAERNIRRKIRETIVKTLEKSDLFKIIDIKSENESRKITIEVDYPRHFKTSSTLRPHIKVEIVFAEALLPVEKKDITTFCAKYKKDTEAPFSLCCVNPVETAAEKFSALLWRVPTTDRTEKLYTIKNDPTLLRHLYDLFALKDFVFKNSANFVGLVRKLYEEDKKRNPSDKNKTLKQAVSETIEKLTEDKAFEGDYKKFVHAMSYAKDNKQISFFSALLNFKKISKMF